MDGLRARALAGVALLMGSCGPIQTTSVLVDADAELAAAKRANAQQRATYEYELASAYLDKAREANGRARYQTAVTFARRSLACAESALRIARSRPAPPDAPTCDPPYRDRDDDDSGATIETSTAAATSTRTPAAGVP